jgi:hypothetical protein
MNSFAKTLHASRYISNYYTVGLHLIKSIHGFPVNIEFVIMNKKQLHLYIKTEIGSVDREHSHTIYSTMLGDMNDSEDNTTALLRRFVDILRHLKFNKFSGRFADERDVDVRNDIRNAEPWEELEDIPFIELEYEKCAVCMDYTMSKTKCKHSLCLDCWRQIPQKKFRYDEEEYEYYPCPICRADCCGFKEELDEDDVEEEED